MLCVQELLQPEKVAQIAHLPHIEALLRSVLVRDPLRRPSLTQIIHRLVACHHVILQSPDVMNCVHLPETPSSHYSLWVGGGVSARCGGGGQMKRPVASMP